jgi:hypothetical protein
MRSSNFLEYRLQLFMASSLRRTLVLFVLLSSVNLQLANVVLNVQECDAIRQPADLMRILQPGSKKNFKKELIIK